MTQWPKVRIAHKDGEFIVLWPGELSTPHKRAGWEILEYEPATQSAGEAEDV